MFLLNSNKPVVQQFLCRLTTKTSKRRKTGSSVRWIHRFPGQSSNTDFSMPWRHREWSNVESARLSDCQFVGINWESFLVDESAERKSKKSQRSIHQGCHSLRTTFRMYFAHSYFYLTFSLSPELHLTIGQHRFSSNEQRSHSSLAQVHQQASMFHGKYNFIQILPSM